MDNRSKLEKLLWEILGEPLYYCEECLVSVSVKTVDGENIVKRNCEHSEANIIAPRKSILSGKGFTGLSLKNKIKMRAQQIASKITKRTI